MFRFWRTISDDYPGPLRNSYAANAALSRAYQAVFLGKPSTEQQQQVLADLKAQTGFSMVTMPEGTTDRELWFREGMRAVYGVIHSHINLSPTDMEALDNAARRERVHANQTIQ